MSTTQARSGIEGLVEAKDWIARSHFCGRKSTHGWRLNGERRGRLTPAPPAAYSALKQ